MKRLKLNCDVMLSTSAFKFNLRRYSLEHTFPKLFESYVLIKLFFGIMYCAHVLACLWQGLTLVHFSAQHKRFLRDRGYI